MLVKNEKKENACYKFSFKVDVKDVGREMDAVSMEIGKKARFPGFRPGKAPVHMVRARYGEQIRIEAARNLISRECLDACKELKIQPYAAPRVDKIDIRDDVPFEFEVEMDIFPSAEIGKLKNVKLASDQVHVADKDIDKEIESVQIRFAEARLRGDDERVQKGDFISADIVCYNGDESIDEMGRKGVRIVVENRDNSTMDIEKLYIGRKKGDTVDVTKPYFGKTDTSQYENFRGDLIITTIEERILPKIDDELAKDAGYESLEKMRESIRNYLENYAKALLDQRFEDKLLESVIAVSKFDIPVTLMETVLKREKENHLKQIQQSIENSDSYFTSHPEQLKQCEDRAEKTTKIMVVLSEIVRQNDFKATPAEIKEFIMGQAVINRAPDAEAYYQTVSSNREQMENVEYQLGNRKAIAFIKENANIKKGKTFALKDVLVNGG